MIVSGGDGSRRRRARMLRITSAEWTPSARALGAGRLDGWKPVAQHGAEDLDHLPVAIRRAPELAADALERVRQLPVLEGGAVPERPRLASEHGARSARGRRSSCRGRRRAGARRRPSRPSAGSRSARRRRGPRRDARPRRRRPSTCCCRSGRGRSSTPRPARRGSRRRARDTARGSAARPRTPPRSSCLRACSGWRCALAQAVQRSSSQALSSS